MRTLGPTEAAAVIHRQLRADHSSRAAPEDHHRLNYLKQVAGHCGVEASPENLEHIAVLLREHGIEIPAGQEYPKVVTRGYDKAQMIANNPTEEDQIVHAEPPPAPQPVGAFHGGPVQDLNLDLSDKVPHIVHDNTDSTLRHTEQAHPGDRPPSDVSDRVPHMEVHHGHVHEVEVQSGHNPGEAQTGEAEPAHDQPAATPEGDGKKKHKRPQ